LIDATSKAGDWAQAADAMRNQSRNVFIGVWAFKDINGLGGEGVNDGDGMLVRSL
jgi:hypothetical protein